MIEVILKADKKVIMETLNRIGIANKKKKILFPSCYLWEQDGKTYIAHFKELFKLTRPNAYDTICEDDILRLKAIIWNLKNWGLIDAKDEDLEPHSKFVFVLPFGDKKDWIISHKFNFKNVSNNIINN
jgi:hypothetical protein